MNGISTTSMPSEFDKDIYKMSPLELNRTQLQVDENNKKIGKPMGAKSDMDKEAFLKLLVTQLSHQDPTSPMEDKEFVSQMAQYSSLEQMRNINHDVRNLIQSSASSQAFNLLGKEVEAAHPVTKQPIQGEVSSVFFVEGQVMLRVGNAEIGLGDIAAVHKKTATQNETGSSN